MNGRLAAVQGILDRMSDAKEEAYRFIRKCDAASEAFIEDRGDTDYCAAYAAAKRSSLDLTRALSHMRNGGEEVMTHTPGPYHITRHDDRVWIEANVGGVVARLAIMDDGAGTQPGNADLFAAAPDMLVALLAFERAAHLNNVCNDDPSASLEWMDASDDAVSRCSAVLKRLRDEGVIAHG